MSFANGNGASNSQGASVPAIWRKDWQFQQSVLATRMHQLLFPEGDEQN
jgi:hypothetical protein